MQTHANPFTKLDKPTVLGSLKATGSRDPDVLHAKKADMVQTMKFPKLAGLMMIFCGVLLSLTIIGAFIGLPMIGIGWFFRRRSAHNLTLIEQVYTEYTQGAGQLVGQT